jgi:hypothetical protein
VEEDYAWAWPVLVPSLEWMLAVVLDALVSFLSLVLVLFGFSPSWLRVYSEQDGMLCYTLAYILDIYHDALYDRPIDEQ